MKPLIYLSILLNVILLYLLFKPTPKAVDYKPILDSIIIEDKARLKADSIRLSNKVDSLSKRIKTINYFRKNERNKYEKQISKLNRPFDSTDFVRINDSLKKVCCSNNTN